MKDVIGTANMAQGNATYFTLDRFGNENSSLTLNGGWTLKRPNSPFLFGFTRNKLVIGLELLILAMF